MIDPSADRASRWCRMGAQYVDDGLHFGTRRGPRAARPFINKKERRRRDAEAGHDRSVSRLGKQEVPYGRAIC